MHAPVTESTRRTTFLQRWDERTREPLSRFTANYGMIFVLLGLCGFFSWVTIAEQHPSGAAAGRQLAKRIVREFKKGSRVLIVARGTIEDAQFAGTLEKALVRSGFTIADVVKGGPIDARAALERITRESRVLDVIAANQTTASWAVFDAFTGDGSRVRSPRPKLVAPESYRWPNFLRRENLFNIANQIAVIALVAVGMTMVILTRGIDLSVGSLIALSAVLATLFIRDWGGGDHASGASMALCSCAAIILCGVVGYCSGILVTWFSVPAFIATLSMMLVASGLAFILAKGQSIYQVPDAFIWLGRGESLGIPNAVWLVGVLYAGAHVLMSHMPLGRYIYAVGGNPQAAHYSGVPVRKVLLFVYVLSGALAGLGGVVMASQLKSGAPTYGLMYELYVIAAVVVGGTSLFGGEGKILGTLIGAFIIAVIQNGMNLTGVESYTQKVVLGLVILGAVVLDNLKKRGWERYLRRSA